MSRIQLDNGDIVIIKSIRYAYDKCIFSYTTYQKNGLWQYSGHDNFSIKYYHSVEDYVNNNTLNN